MLGSQVCQSTARGGQAQGKPPTTPPSAASFILPVYVANAWLVDILFEIGHGRSVCVCVSILTPHITFFACPPFV